MPFINFCINTKLNLAHDILCVPRVIEQAMYILHANTAVSVF